MTMSRFVKLGRSHLFLLREQGLKHLVWKTLSDLGVNIDIYSTVKYPITDIEVKVRIRNPDMFFWKNLEEGRWELNCIKFVSNMIQKGQTVLDVGAWIGQYTLLFSKLVKGTGQVYAFEPDPVAFDVLCHNIEKNCSSNVHVERICLSNSQGKTKLRSYQFGNSGSSIIRDKQETHLREIIVEATTIDRYCGDNGIVPEGIKIDVEGAEKMVMEGCRNIIEKYSPWILLEFHSSRMSKQERLANWHKVTDSAEEIIFIDGDSDQYHYGGEVKSLPDCERFHVFIKY